MALATTQALAELGNALLKLWQSEHMEGCNIRIGRGRTRFHGVQLCTRDGVTAEFNANSDTTPDDAAVYHLTRALEETLKAAGTGEYVDGLLLPTGASYAELERRELAAASVQPFENPSSVINEMDVRDSADDAPEIRQN